MAHYSSGLSLLRTSPHDPTFQGSSPGISVPMLGQTTQSISSTQLFNHSDSLEHFGTNFSVVPFSWSGKFHGFSSMLSAIQRTAKTIQNTSCEEWLFSLALVSIQSQVIHGGLAFLRPLNHRKTNCGSLSGHSVLFCFPSHKLVLLPESDLQTESSASFDLKKRDRK